jgi:Domain of unknown function (DUF4349)
MKVVRFPGSHSPGSVADQSAEIEAALRGESVGVEAESWRLLRQDVRALAPPIDSDLERELQERLAAWAADEGNSAGSSLKLWLAHLRARLAGLAVGRRFAAGGAVVSLVITVLALVLVGPLRSGSGSLPPQASLRSNALLREDAAPVKAAEEPVIGTAGEPSSSSSSAASSTVTPSAAGSPTSAPGHLQQLGASVTLATSSSGVQAAAEGVSRLGVGDGGFVESSHVQVKSNGPSEADVTLSIPSAKLSATIAALGRIASVRAVSQSSQDITGSYDSAQRRLGDAVAERRALLRALAAASTQGQIDSLREQLSGNREALTRDRSDVRSVSHQAATSQLYVTITGGKSAEGGGLTLRRGLDDAGDVLATAGAALLIGLAGLLPITLLAFCLLAVRRAWRRRRREAALDL